MNKEQREARLRGDPLPFPGIRGRIYIDNKPKNQLSWAPAVSFASAGRRVNDTKAEICRVTRCRKFLKYDSVSGEDMDPQHCLNEFVF